MHCDKLFFEALLAKSETTQHNTTQQQNKFLEARDAHALKNSHQARLTDYFTPK